MHQIEAAQQIKRGSAVDVLVAPELPPMPPILVADRLAEGIEGEIGIGQCNLAQQGGDRISPAIYIDRE